MCKKDENTSRADDIRYQFTAYLKKAVEHKRRDYIERELRYKSQMTLIDLQDEAMLSDLRKDCECSLSISDEEIGNEDLEKALGRLSEKETLILYARAVNGEDFKHLAIRLDLTVNGAYSAYHRIVVKLRKELGGQKNAL